MAQPHVARWYARPDATLEWAARPPEGGDHALIEVAGQPIGYLRWQRVGRETLDSVGLPEIPEGSVDADILIGADADTGRGYGPAALRALVARLQREPEPPPLLGLTSELENHRAHRAFERAGFHIARQYEAPPIGLCHLLLLDLGSEREA